MGGPAHCALLGVPGEVAGRYNVWLVPHFKLSEYIANLPRGWFILSLIVRPGAGSFATLVDERMLKVEWCRVAASKPTLVGEVTFTGHEVEAACKTLLSLETRDTGTVGHYARQLKLVQLPENKGMLFGGPPGSWFYDRCFWVVGNDNHPGLTKAHEKATICSFIVYEEDVPTQRLDSALPGIPLLVVRCVLKKEGKMTSKALAEAALSARGHNGLAVVVQFFDAEEGGGAEPETIVFMAQTLLALVRKPTCSIDERLWEGAAAAGWRIAQAAAGCRHYTYHAPDGSVYRRLQDVPPPPAAHKFNAFDLLSKQKVDLGSLREHAGEMPGVRVLKRANTRAMIDAVREARNEASPPTALTSMRHVHTHVTGTTRASFSRCLLAVCEQLGDLVVPADSFDHDKVHLLVALASDASSDNRLLSVAVGCLSEHKGNYRSYAGVQASHGDGHLTPIPFSKVDLIVFTAAGNEIDLWWVVPTDAQAYLGSTSFPTEFKLPRCAVDHFLGSDKLRSADWDRYLAVTWKNSGPVSVMRDLALAGVCRGAGLVAKVEAVWAATLRRRAKLAPDIVALHPVLAPIGAAAAPGTSSSHGPVHRPAPRQDAPPPETLSGEGAGVEVAGARSLRKRPLQGR